MSSATVRFPGDIIAQVKNGKWSCPARPELVTFLESASQGFSPHVGDFNPDRARAQFVIALLDNGAIDDLL